MKPKFFIEGGSDLKFITDFVKVRFGIDLTKENFTEQTNGFNIRYIELNAPLIRDALTRGFTPIIILDADSDFELRKNQITADLTTQDLNQIKHFLFPNHNSAGNLENLLLELIVDNNINNSRMTCFENYKTCLGQDATLPDNKTKVYSLVVSLGKEAKPNKIDFKDTDVFNLTDEYVQPFYDFLNNLFNPPV